MQITTTVCDICYSKGSFHEQEILHKCGELGDFCEDHFTMVYNYITDLKKDSSFRKQGNIVVNGIDEDTKEEVSVSFNPVKSEQPKSNPKYEELSKKKLPWL